MSEVKLDKITAQTLNDWLKGVGQGDKVILTKVGDSFRLALKAKGDDREREVPHGMINSVGFSNVHANWFVASNPPAFAPWRDFGKEIKEKKKSQRKKGVEEINAERYTKAQTLELEIFFSENELEVVTTNIPGIGELKRITLPHGFAFTRLESDSIVGYQPAGGGYESLVLSEVLKKQ